MFWSEVSKQSVSAAQLSCAELPSSFSSLSVDFLEDESKLDLMTVQEVASLVEKVHADLR